MSATSGLAGSMATQPVPRRPVRDLARRAFYNLTLLGILLVLLLAFSAPFTLKTVGPGETGVLWRRFSGGTVLDHTLGEGMHLILPWDRLYIYSLRLDEYRHTYDTISSDGLNMGVEIAVRYRVDPRYVALLHKHVGPDYLKILMDPAVGSQARELISLYTPEELYKSARGFIQNQITERLNRDNLVEIEEAGGAVSLLLIEDVLLRGIAMPESVKVAIERKAEQNQVMLEYEFRLQREERERERRRIEAAGLRAYQDAMPTGIAPSYLVLRGIEATLELAKSQNAKLVFFGNDSGNLPFVLNSMLGQLQSQAATTPASIRLPPEAAPMPQVLPPLGSPDPGPAGAAAAPPEQTGRLDVLHRLMPPLLGAPREWGHGKRGLWISRSIR